MVVDLKVLDRIDDDDPEHIKISFGTSFFLIELGKVIVLFGE